MKQIIIATVGCKLSLSENTRALLAQMPLFLPSPALSGEVRAIFLATKFSLGRGKRTHLAFTEYNLLFNDSDDQTPSSKCHRGTITSSKSMQNHRVILVGFMKTHRSAHAFATRDSLYYTAVYISVIHDILIEKHTKIQSTDLILLKMQGNNSALVIERWLKDADKMKSIAGQTEVTYLQLTASWRMACLMLPWLYLNLIHAITHAFYQEGVTWAWKEGCLVPKDTDVQSFWLPFGPSCLYWLACQPLKVRNIITTAEQITLFYGTFRGPQRMNLADFGDLLNLHPSQPHNKMCPLVLSAGQNVP